MSFIGHNAQWRINSKLLISEDRWKSSQVQSYPRGPCTSALVPAPLWKVKNSSALVFVQMVLARTQPVFQWTCSFIGQGTLPTRSQFNRWEGESYDFNKQSKVGNFHCAEFVLTCVNRHEQDVYKNSNYYFKKIYCQKARILKEGIFVKLKVVIFFLLIIFTSNELISHSVNYKEKLSSHFNILQELLLASKCSKAL